MARDVTCGSMVTCLGRVIVRQKSVWADPYWCSFEYGMFQSNSRNVLTLSILRMKFIFLNFFCALIISMGGSCNSGWLKSLSFSLIFLS